MDGKSLKYYRLFFLLLLVITIGGVVFLYYQHSPSRPSTVDQKKGPYRQFSGPRVRIGGFHFDGYYKGKRIISIDAEKFTIEKKKLGFLRFGLLNVAKLQNAVIDIYGESLKLPEKDIQETPPQTGDLALTKPQPIKGVTFKDVFRKESLPSFPVKRITSIKIVPITLKLHDEKSLVTQISAASATLRLRHRDILFNGDVRVISGPRVLKTDQLSLVPEKAIIKTGRPFRLKTPGKKLEGDHLETDIFLRMVGPDGL